MTPTPPPVLWPTPTPWVIDPDAPAPFTGLEDGPYQFAENIVQGYNSFTSLPATDVFWFGLILVTLILAILFISAQIGELQ